MAKMTEIEVPVNLTIQGEIPTPFLEKYVEEVRKNAYNQGWRDAIDAALEAVDNYFKRR